VSERLHILFASPVYWPALAFGGPIWAARELNDRAAVAGHEVVVVTTSLVDLHGERTFRTRSAEVGGATVHYLATPARYRWMGITPSLALALRGLSRPDVVHVFGFRDVVTTGVARWARRNDIPYVFEPLGMFMPRVRKVRFKRLFDASAVKNVARGAALLIASSEHEKQQIAATGVVPDRVAVRGNGFPPPAEDTSPPEDTSLRQALGIEGAPLVLYVGRIAKDKGVDVLLDAVRGLDGVHVVFAGPDDGHGVGATLDAAEAAPQTAGRVHRLTPESRPLDLYREADVFVLPSAGESFGMVAAEAAAVGTPVVVTDRCGVAEFLGDDGALVVPYDGGAIREAISRILHDARLRESLRAGGFAAAERYSWAEMARRQEDLYRLAIARGG
jgi:glycosyltransferase involved in cell wall biosynthesis